MKWSDKACLREFLFRASVLLKGLDALLEIVGGVAAWMVSPSLIVRVVGFLTQDEIREDPHDLVANCLRHAASRFTLGSKYFLAVYLLGHGIVKLFVVLALLKNKLWGYPAALIVFGGFVVYQIYRFTLTGGIGLIALSIVDLVVMWFIWLEYRAVKQHLANARNR